MKLIMKIASGIGTAAFAGGLVYGGVYRTQVKTAQEVERELAGNGVRQEQLLQQNLRDEGGRDEGSRQGGGREGIRSEDGNGERGAGSSATSTDVVEQGRGYGGGRESEGRDFAQQEADVSSEELVTLHTVVLSVDEEVATFLAEDGEEIVMEGRALSFASELGFSLVEGDEVTLTGFYEGADFEVSLLENLTTGMMATLREPEGRPLWAGGSGRRGGL